MDRYDMVPHIEDRLTMTIREWLVFHYTMPPHHTRYLGRKVLKTPFDWVVLGDIIEDTKPEVIIEIGCYEGGSTLWMANLLDAMNTSTRIIRIDGQSTPTAVQHPRITWLIGDCLDPKILQQVEQLCGGKRGMVIEDSDHKYHVTKAILD